MVGGVPLPTRGSSVPDIEIARTLKQLAGNAFFFFDTCHPARQPACRSRARRITTSLSTRLRVRPTPSCWRALRVRSCPRSAANGEQGAFTKALLEGLAGKAHQYTPGVVTIDELNLYVKERVKELTGGLQHPVDLKPREARNIAFAMVP